MRPACDALVGRSRKDPEATNPAHPMTNSTPTSFFMATEDMLRRPNREPVAEGSESTFGVESLQETTCNVANVDENEKNDSDSHEDRKWEGRRRSTLKPVVRDRDSSPESLERALQDRAKDASVTHSSIRPTSAPSASESLTSLSQVSQLQGLSLPSSPKSTSTRSFRPSDEESMDEVASQAIVSSEEEEEYSVSELQDSAPQLIMPSIRMPSRRPFTEKGKGTGRLKILIAGDSGVGKTSLIKSIVQTCEDIVHVDPLTPNHPYLDQLRPRRPKSRHGKLNANSTDQITEVYASTRAYPPWWTEIDESKVFRKRKSLGESVMERNVCFVDTPGYSRTLSMTEGIESVVQYVKAQLVKATSFTTVGEGELVSMLSGKGGTQVDVALYMIAQKLKPVDLDFIRQLSALTNVIPLIAKADSLSHDEAQALKESIASDLISAGLRPFLFNSESTISPPYTVCSASSNDDENMDASLLMSPEYVRPLVSSELSTLVHHIFDKDNVSWLRHFAAKKLVHSQRAMEKSFVPAPFPNSPTTFNPLPNSFPDSSTSQISSSSTSQAVISYASGASSYVQARIADHTQREEKLAQLRLAKWAGDLQRCLQNERTRYEAISRGERAIWLTQRLGECVDDGSLVPVRGPEKDTISMRTGPMESSLPAGLVNARDPLGLLGWNEAVRRRGWIAVQVVGGFGVLGAMAVWMVRSWGAGADAYSSWTWAWWAGKV